MPNGNVMTIHLIAGLIKRVLYKNKSMLWSNHAKKADLKNTTDKLKAEIDKIDVDKLKTVHVHLSKSSSVVINDIVKKTVYDKLVAKVNNIDIGGFALKTKYQTDKSDLAKKISDGGKKIYDTCYLYVTWYYVTC